MFPTFTEPRQYPCEQPASRQSPHTRDTKGGVACLCMNAKYSPLQDMFYLTPVWDTFQGHGNKRHSRHLAASQFCPLYALCWSLPWQPALREWELGTTVCTMRFHWQTGDDEHHNSNTTGGVRHTASDLNVSIESLMLKDQSETSYSSIIAGRK